MALAVRSAATYRGFRMKSIPPVTFAKRVSLTPSETELTDMSMAPSISICMLWTLLSFKIEVVNFKSMPHALRLSSITTARTKAAIF